MNIRMKSKVFEIKKILRKTQAQGMKDLKVGDKIQFETGLQYTTCRRGNSASNVAMINLQTSERTWKSESMWLNLLDSFELEEVAE